MEVADLERSHLLPLNITIQEYISFLLSTAHQVSARFLVRPKGIYLPTYFVVGNKLIIHLRFDFHKAAITLLHKVIHGSVLGDGAKTLDRVLDASGNWKRELFLLVIYNLIFTSLLMIEVPFHYRKTPAHPGTTTLARSLATMSHDGNACSLRSSS
ncbi:hypothetical protein F5Y10DRAFT_26243 [Nemania abortiva]|nr:hypothetical protein F5Y10DRAFT_26243 [Nemania abortiva]